MRSRSASMAARSGLSVVLSVVLTGGSSSLGPAPGHNPGARPVLPAGAQTTTTVALGRPLNSQAVTLV